MSKCLSCGNEVKNKYCNVSCQNSHQNKFKNDKKFGKIESFEVKCVICQVNFSVLERKNLFPQKSKYYCDRGCANKRNDDKSETKSIICGKCKLGKEVNKRSRQKVCNQCKIKPPRKLREKIISSCILCEKEIIDKKIRTYCSNSCSTKYKNQFQQMSIRGGQKSAKSQNKRSRNEIAFADLCKSNFKNVLTNEPIFNGWDADVIIEDMKIAILWNGLCHYKKIWKHQSLEQIQNRDKIKMDEIIKHGYSPYIIQDFGSHDLDKVKNEWEKFNSWLSTTRRNQLFVPVIQNKIPTPGSR